MSNIQPILDNPLLIGFILLSIAVIILLGFIIHLQAKLNKFLIGKNSDNIGDSLSHVRDSLNDLESFRKELEEYLAHVEKRLRRSVQSVHTIRFNPFKGAGGGSNQSFATSFLNEEGDGVVVSSLYSRDHVSVFAKPVNKYSSEHGLSEEEKTSLEESRNKLSK